VNANPDIKQVITYNDIGGWELHEGGKYANRFYLEPTFASSTAARFAAFDGFYLVVGMPPLATDSAQVRYFTQCGNVHHAVDGQVIADVYDCRGVPFTP
jgi:hypothetical protein